LHAASGTKKGIRSENPAVVLYGYTEKKNGRLHFQGCLAFGGFHFGASALQVHRGRLAPNTQELIQNLFSIQISSLCLVCEAVFI
jgi:hypothetical protein